MRRVLSVLLAVGLVSVTANCGKKAEERAAEKAIEKAIEKQSGGKAKVDLSKGQVTIRDKEGQATFTEKGGAQLPEGFPADVPVYKGAAIVMSSKQQKSFTLMLTAGDDRKKVAETYKSAMKSQGWEEETTVDVGEALSLQYKKDKRTVGINISQADDKTQIVLIVNAEEQ